MAAIDQLLRRGLQQRPTGAVAVMLRQNIDRVDLAAEPPFLAGGLLIQWVEPATFPNVLTAYAWAIATLVTAGHTTPEPITVAGRAISSTIVVLGLGSFVALAASLTGPRDQG